MKPLRTVFALLIAAGLGVLGAQWLSQQNNYDLGQVTVSIGGNDYLAPIPQAMLLLLIAVLMVWLAWTLLCFPFRAWNRYCHRKVQMRLFEGLRAADHGQWQRAEYLLVHAAEDKDVAGIALAGAVRATDAREDEAAAAQLLQQLAERDPTTYALLQAERHLIRARPVDAINTLDAATQPLPPRGLLLRTRALSQIGRADEAYGQLGALRQQAVLSPSAYAKLEIALAEQIIHEAQDANALAQHWESLPKALRTQPGVVRAYAQRAAALHWDDAAVHSLEHALDNQWDESLARLYGSLPLEKYHARHASAQRWLAEHPESPALLLTLARLARHQQQWEHAEAFLHRAIAQGAGAEAWEELGHRFAAAGDATNAQHCYANALRVSRNQTPRALPAEASPTQTATTPQEPGQTPSLPGDEEPIPPPEHRP